MKISQTCFFWNLGVVGSLTEAGGLIGQVGAAAGVAAGAVAGAELARRAFSKWNFWRKYKHLSTQFDLVTT